MIPSGDAMATSSDLRDVFTSGYDHCQSWHLTSLGGLTLSQIANRVCERQAKVKQNPGNVFGVAITLGAHVIEVRYGSRIVRSGRLPEGCVTYSEPGQLIHTETPDAWDALFIHLPCRLIERVCESAEIAITCKDLDLINASPAKDEKALNIARRAQMEIRLPGPFSKLRAEMIAQELIVHILSFHSTASNALGGTRRTGGLAPWQLRRAMDLMDASAEKNITLAALAQAAGCSTAHFSRAFRQSTGLAPFAWLLNCKIERAKALLRDPRNTLAETALAVGFSAQPQFTAAFRRVTGQPPGAWRRHQSF